MSMEPWAATKKLSVSVAVPPAPVRVPSQRPLGPSVASVTSVANDKDDNGIILGAVHRSPGICLTAEENLLLDMSNSDFLKIIDSYFYSRFYIFYHLHII